MVQLFYKTPLFYLLIINFIINSEKIENILKIIWK